MAAIALFSVINHYHINGVVSIFRHPVFSIHEIQSTYSRNRRISILVNKSGIILKFCVHIDKKTIYRIVYENTNAPLKAKFFFQDK